MLTAESYEEMERIVGDLKEGKIIMKKLKELGLDDEFGMYYDAEIVHRKEINSARSDDIMMENKKVKERAKKKAKKKVEKRLQLLLLSQCLLKRWNYL